MYSDFQRMISGELRKVYLDRDGKAACFKLILHLFSEICITCFLANYFQSNLHRIGIVRLDCYKKIMEMLIPS